MTRCTKPCAACGPHAHYWYEAATVQRDRAMQSEVANWVLLRWIASLLENNEASSDLRRAA